MTDLYIEQATSAFQHLWSGSGQLTATMPDIQESLHLFNIRLKATEHALASAVHRIESQETIIQKLRDEMLAIQGTSDDTTRRLHQIEGTDGLLQSSQLFTEVRKMPEIDSIRSLREQLMSLHQRQGETATTLTLRQQAIEERLQDVVDRAAADASRSLLAQVARVEEEHQNAVHRLTTSIAKVSSSVAEAQAHNNQSLREATTHLERALGHAKEDARNNLEASMTEIVTHLKQQALMVDDLQSEAQRRAETGLTTDHVEQLRGEMRSVRSDIDRAQFRMHEAYSQMMSLAHTTGAPSTTANATSALGSTAALTHTSGSSVFPPSQPHDPSSSSAISYSAGSAPPPSAAFMESALEPIRRDLLHVQRSLIPSLSTAIQGQQAATDGLVAMHRRAQELLGHFLSCLGLRDRLDELYSSLETMDAAHVLLMARTAMDTVYPPHILAQRAASSSSSTRPPQVRGLHVAPEAAPVASQASYAARSSLPTATTPYALDATPIRSTPHQSSPAPSVTHSVPLASTYNTDATPSSQRSQHTPLHYRGAAKAQGSSAALNPQPFQLGLDVADGPEGGACIMSVLPNSVGERYGLRVSEVLRRVNGHMVEGANHFATLMRTEERAIVANARSGGHTATLSLVVVSPNLQSRVVDIPLPT